MDLFVAVVLSAIVMDGDTMRVNARVWPGIVVEERVRLLDVDTPELRSSSECERILAKVASAWVTEKLAGAKSITLIAGAHDSFGRILGHVYVDGVSINRLLIEAGIARPYGVSGAWC
jgi:micrococcal nuclease